MRLLQLQPSPNPLKKWMATFEDPKRTTHFGQKGALDYTILKKHHDPTAEEHKERYKNRHKKDLATHDPASPGYMSFYILWNKPTLRASLQDYKERFNL